jgi:hypothetical protein
LFPQIKSQAAGRSAPSHSALLYVFVPLDGYSPLSLQSFEFDTGKIHEERVAVELTLGQSSSEFLDFSLSL